LKNLADNNLRFPLLAAAVSGESGILRLRIGSNSTCSTLIDGELIHPGHTGAIDIPCLTIPEVLQRLGWSGVDLLKVDIEGAEESLFSHSPQWLHDVQAIVLEIHPNTSPEKIQSLLEPFGFRLRRQSFGNEPVFFADRSAY
jgi:FkbM family methyltransferase